MTVTLGDGDDHATFGANTITQRVETFSTFKLFGGTGTGDTLSLMPNGNVFHQAPVIAGFEIGS